MIEFLGWIFLFIIIYTVFRLIKTNIKKKKMKEAILLYSLADMELPECIETAEIPTWVREMNLKEARFFVKQLNSLLCESFFPFPETSAGRSIMLIYAYICARAIEKQNGDIFDQIAFAGSKIRQFVEIEHNDFEMPGINDLWLFGFDSQFDINESNLISNYDSLLKSNSNNVSSKFK